MKRLVFFTLLLIIWAVQSGFSSPENAQLYNRANEHYTKKEYHEALELYTELVDRGVEHPSLYYNAANTYFKIGMIGHAVLNYERALLLKPFDRDIRANLQYVNNQLEDKIRPLYNEGAFRFFQEIVSLMRLKLTVYFELVLFTVLIVLLLSFLFAPNSRRQIRRALIVVGIVYIAILIGMIAQYSYDRRYPKGIILQEVLEVKSSPLAESETLFDLHEGIKFKLIEKRGEWIRLSIADGRQGWILQESVALIRSHKLM
jgi:tetratricopeptide (TPR) repeat protein